MAHNIFPPIENLNIGQNYFIWADIFFFAFLHIIMQTQKFSIIHLALKDCFPPIFYQRHMSPQIDTRSLNIAQIDVIHITCHMSISITYPQIQIAGSE